MSRTIISHEINNPESKNFPMKETFFHCSACNESFMEHGKYTTHCCTHRDASYSSANNNSSFAPETYLASNHLSYNKKKSQPFVVSEETHVGKDDTTSVSQDKPFRCDVCNRRYAQKKYLAHHRRTHTGLKPFTCHVCRKSFVQKPHLDTHYRIHIGDKCHICDICGRSFIQKINLTNHYRVHTGERPFACEECGKSFNQRSHLTRHCQRFLHAEKKPSNDKKIQVHHFAPQTIFSCDFCNRSFASKMDYTKHYCSHVVKKESHSCDFCKESFALEHQLAAHYTDCKKCFSCDVCDCRFPQTSDLIKHYLSHIGKKPRVL